MIDIQATTRRSLRVDECVELIGVSRRTIYYWLDNGMLVDAGHAGPNRMIAIESVRRVITLRTPPALRVTPLHTQQV